MEIEVYVHGLWNNVPQTFRGKYLTGCLRKDKLTTVSAFLRSVKTNPAEWLFVHILWPRNLWMANVYNEGQIVRCSAKGSSCDVPAPRALTKVAA